MKRTVIVRVTETEFETEDGRVYQHPIPFLPGEVPTPAEFQVEYDRWADVLRQLDPETPDER